LAGGKSALAFALFEVPGDAVDALRDRREVLPDSLQFGADVVELPLEEGDLELQLVRTISFFFTAHSGKVQTRN